MTRSIRTDFIIVGSGIAGIRAAIELAELGQVVVLTKSKPDESNTEYAQGGVAVAMSDEDEIGLHYQDTIRAGDGLCAEPAVQVLVEEGPDRIQELIDWGTEFDREGSTRLAFTREAAHSRNRILHAGGDSTGHEINRTLIRKVRSLDNVTLFPYSFALDLLIGGAGCEGITYLEEKTGRVKELRARSILLATGGIGNLYRETTNPDVATGDGYALAFRAGAALTDMEFVQFHPTALKLKSAPHFLLSEALRGEGGRLKNDRGEVFMHHYHPMGDLAPRDVVSRAIFTEAAGSGGDKVLLDLTELDGEFIQKRFPRIFATCLSFGLDIRRAPIPVFPAAHYMMGGVYTDLCSRTTVPGLFAAGEVACNGVHGANRLASNSLLEGLVLGARAGKAMAADRSGVHPNTGVLLEQTTWNGESSSARLEGGFEIRRDIRDLMSDRVGIVRTKQGLQTALDEFYAFGFSADVSRQAHETNNLLVNARLVTAMALLRQESRGAHYRADYPQRDDATWGVHLRAQYDAKSNQIDFRTLKAEVTPSLSRK
ncbi:MAG: L-aspartate oxidase [Acidobacteriota bacterium]